MTHVGRERMEASAWRPSYGPHRPLLRSEPLLRSALWFVVLGALLVAFTLCWAALTGTVTDPPVEPGVTRWHVRFESATDAVTGLPVTRDQWIAEALR